MSKKILEQKQRKEGKAYVPIHQRMSEVLREKQEHIARIQRKTRTYEEVEERECTFKPVINNNWPHVQSRLNTTVTTTRTKKMDEVDATMDLDVSSVTIRKAAHTSNLYTNGHHSPNGHRNEDHSPNGHTNRHVNRSGNEGAVK